jgi:uncharacterized protein involved in tolerance to divalent cations
MFYNSKDEVIFKNSQTQAFFPEAEKVRLAQFLNNQLKELTTISGKYLRYKNPEINMVEEALSRAPMFVNALMSRGYKNILFVGHFNDGQTHWMLDELAGRMIDIMPPERMAMQSFPDMNIIAQFIPTLMKIYQYDCSFVIPRPPEDKYKGVMHDIYDINGMKENFMACSQQYKHGQSTWTLEGEHEKFDAVVFLGVPMTDKEVGFEESQVREIFAPHCTPEFEMVDIYYGAPSSVKWFNGEKKESDSMVDTAFSISSLWDEDTAKGRPEESDIMKRMISVF